MRLWLKILLATGAVIVICLVVAGALAGIFIVASFERFATAQERSAVQRLAPSLASFYERNGSWAGLERFVEVSRGRRVGLRLLLLDKDGRVVLDTQDELTGQKVSRQVWESGEPILVQGHEVGRLISGSNLTQARRISVLAQGTRRSIIVALLGAGLAGASAAIIVATILALQITAPARDLTEAARRVAAGDLKHRVPVHSQDELGEVGAAFNDMAAALSRQEELRRHMVADIAHELRTPLSVMQVELEALQDGLAEPSPEAVASLREEVELLSRLVEDLRVLSLMDAGQLQLELQAVVLPELVQNVAQQVSAVAGRKGITLSAEVPAGLPSARVDPDRLRQVLFNLFSNALRHTPAGGSVRLLALDEGSRLHLQVADTGEGIAAEDLPHIFDRFYRADPSRSRTTGGSGLGLTIARGLVEAMGGHIWAESTPGRGTAIHFTLPRG